MIRSTLTLSILLFSVILFAQKVNFFPADVFPAKPFGGEEELERLVKQCMVYPESALEKEIEGNVEFKFKVASGGKVTEFVVTNEPNPELMAAAILVFKRIAWLADPGVSSTAGDYNELIIEFSVKKYKKLIKKRGYESLNPFMAGDSLDFNAYGINKLDKKPKIKDAKDINYFVRDNFKYPPIALQRGISGRVSMEFIIEPYGLCSNIQILGSLPGGCDEEAKRLVRLMEWEAGEIDGKAVRTIYRYDLNFMHPGSEIR